MLDRHYQFVVAPQKTEEFAAAIGDVSQDHDGEVAPTYAMALIGSKLLALLSSLDIDPATDTVIHTSQRFDYTRRLRAGEGVGCRVSIADPCEQMHGRTVQLTCIFTSADGSPIVTITTGLLITRSVDHTSAKGRP